MTSFEVVAAVKRLTGERHTGHAGTLDPAATGVLPVCLGKSTRVVEYLMDATKTYQAQIELGVTTDTYDAAGKILKTADASSVTFTQIESVLSQFRGNIQQVPPAYSALKQHGRPLYSYARAGVAVTPKSREVTIHEITVLDWQPQIITLRVVCSKGTYIRSLAHDIGEKLGCGAHLKSLVREKYGPFDIKEAVSVRQLEEICRGGTLESILYPIDTVLTHMQAVVLNEDYARIVINGGSLALPEILKPAQSSMLEARSSMYCRAYSAGGSLIAVLHYHPETEKWHPEKVFL